MEVRKAPSGAYAELWRPEHRSRPTELIVSNGSDEIVRFNAKPPPTSPARPPGPPRSLQTLPAHAEHARRRESGCFASAAGRPGSRPREPDIGKPFAWTAGRMFFRWFSTIGVDELRFRGAVYMAAVCRCFPGKRRTAEIGCPLPDEIENCSSWLAAEMGSTVRSS